jgi:hypothetical protein
MADECMPCEFDGDWTAICDVDNGEPSNLVAWSHPANAALIAAAPDMLAALIEAESVLRTFRECDRGIAPATEAKVRAAIDKAKGGGR